MSLKQILSSNNQKKCSFLQAEWSYLHSTSHLLKAQFSGKNIFGPQMGGWVDCSIPQPVDFFKLSFLINWCLIMVAIFEFQFSSSRQPNVQITQIKHVLCCTVCWLLCVCSWQLPQPCEERSETERGPFGLTILTCAEICSCFLQKTGKL